MILVCRESPPTFSSALAPFADAIAWHHIVLASLLYFVNAMIVIFDVFCSAFGYGETFAQGFLLGLMFYFVSATDLI